MPAASITAKHLLTIVIASVCDDARAHQLKRACDSVRAMAGDHDYSIVVVANGARVSSNVLEWLATEPAIRVIRLKSGSYPLARRIGAEMADSEFLGFLDDDDELLPDTLATKLAYFREHPEVDVLVTDGLRINGSTVSRIMPPPQARSADAVETAMRMGWGACALTLRSRNIDLAVFDSEFRHLEWTLTALELAKRYRFGFLDEATYRYYEDTPGSLSKLAEHHLVAPELWRRLMKSYAGTRYLDSVRRRFATECHQVAWEHACQGRMREAWRLHAQSLMLPGGMAMLPFSAKLLFAPLRRVLVRDRSRGMSAGSPS
jgi:glycosyltransferase involved in cell wall biosynthesis